MCGIALALRGSFQFYKKTGRPGSADLPESPTSVRICLESQLQSELDQSRVIDCVVDDSESTRSIDVLLATAPRSAHIELRVIEQVEELRPELQSHPFPERQREVLDDREIRVYETRSINRGPGSRAEFSGGRLRERTGIEPILNRVNL